MSVCQCCCCESEDYYDLPFDDDDREAQEEQCIMSKLNNCVCGAYTTDQNGQFIIIADCCCGA